jgi:hypothetical protein
VKVSISIFLILLWIVEAPLLYLTAKLERETLRESRSERMQPDKLIHMIIQNSEAVIWEDEGNEMIYKGKRYDVIRVELKGQTTELIVYEDYKEQALDFRTSSDTIPDDALILKRLLPFAVIPIYEPLVLHRILYRMNRGTFNAGIKPHPPGPEYPPPEAGQFA